jgi:hypothetical protein
MKYLIFSIGMVCSVPLFAQTLIQTIRGSVVDQQTQFPLPGAAVVVASDSSELKSFKGTVTDENGNFRVEDVPVGRHTIKISFIGYEDRFLNNVLVTSAKEVVLDIGLEQAATKLEEVTVTAGRDGEASNEMAVSSARSFTVEETQRYAGSRGDPARMASNFAGVQGADDSRNDIVIRGNSPLGLLWRMEGINIPNPNHFNIPGTGGGPVSMINNKTLANSDFFTGAFPAEYGNSVAGVFDLKLRNGNNEHHEFSGQFGFLGTELFAEGPLSHAHKASYLFSYRYSSLAIFNKLGIDIGTAAVPHYQDLAFKVNLPGKNKGSLSLFGIGGKSDIDILISEQKQPDRNLYGENDRDQYFRSSSGVVGMSYKNPISSSAFVVATVALTGEMVNAWHIYVNRHLDTQNEYVVDSMKPMLDYKFTQTKASAFLLYARKMGSGGVLNMGLSSDLYFFDFRDSVRNVDETSSGYLTWRTRWNSRDRAILLQPFVQWKYNLSEKLHLTAGLHSQYFSLSNSLAAVEPRGGVNLSLDERSSVNLGVGLHSQLQPTYLYYYGENNDSQGNPIPHNKKMDFTKSLHVVGGYQRFLGSDLKLKVEAYYQRLYNVPVERKSSSFSLLNTGAGFARFFPDSLVNTGMGKNYGLEVTLEKFFSNGYLFLVTGSLFEARYQGSDRVWRDTDFNGNYIFNALFTKEWFLKSRNTFAVGGKVTTAGGRRYGPVDEAASETNKEIVWVDATRNSHQFSPYFRADLSVNYKINRRQVTHEIALDLVNLFDTKNILKLTYSPNDFADSPIRKEYQLGFLPLFSYRIDF